jgi:DNA-binding Lrp family transcriptional regulator
VRAFCGISVNARSASAVIRALERLPEVEEVWAVSGQYDYMVLFRCDTPEQLDALLDQIGLVDGISQTHTSLVLSRKIDRRSSVT